MHPFPPRSIARVRTIIGAAAFALPLAAAQAATLQVTTTIDTIGADGLCSLREAIVNANGKTALFVAAGECAAATGGDTIRVPAGIYMLAVGDLLVSAGVIIAGAGAAETIIDGNHASRVFFIRSESGPVAISDLTVGRGAPVPAGGGGGNPLTNFGGTSVHGTIVADPLAGVNRSQGGPPMASSHSIDSGTSCGFDGKPTWLIAVAELKSPGVYRGPISTVTGPPYNAVPFLPGNVVETEVGTITITFKDGNRATYDYTVGDIHQVKTIERQVFAGTGTVCQ